MYPSPGGQLILQNDFSIGGASSWSIRCTEWMAKSWHRTFRCRRNLGVKAPRNPKPKQLRVVTYINIDININICIFIYYLSVYIQYIILYV